MNIPVWKWDPEKYCPKHICGPDIIMRDSAYGELIKYNQDQCALFFRLATKTTEIGPDTVYCPAMNRMQKQEFLSFHSARYNYPIHSEIYVDLIKSFESVWYIICLDHLNIKPDKLNIKDSNNQSIINEFRSRNQFPPSLLSLIDGCSD